MQRVKNGNIYENGQPIEINFILGENLTIQGVGIGTYEVYGRMRNGEYKKLSLVDNTTYDIATTGKDGNIYKADIAGLSYITVQNVTGNFESIYYDISMGDKSFVRSTGGGGGEMRDIETYNDAQYVYWRFVGDTEWKILIDLSVIYAAVDDHVDEVISTSVDTGIEDNTATPEEVDEAIENLDDLG